MRSAHRMKCDDRTGTPLCEHWIGLMQTLAGVKLLIVEDEFLIAEDMARYFAKMGAEVLGPVPSVERARSLAEQADAAILHVKNGGTYVFSIADRLSERGVPFVFFTGYELSAIPHRLRHACSLRKPVSQQVIMDALFPDGIANRFGTLPEEQNDDTVLSALPKLRLAARILLSDPNAADRLVEKTLEIAIPAVADRPEGQSTEDWLNSIFRRVAGDSGRLLH